MNIRCSILLLSLNICGKFWQKWILESNKKRDFFMLRNNSKFILFRIVETTANCKYFRGHCSGRTTVFICLCRGTWSEETESWLKLERMKSSNEHRWIPSTQIAPIILLLKIIWANKQNQLARSSFHPWLCKLFQLIVGLHGKNLCLHFTENKNRFS